jgi:hypothetical protein
MKLGSIEYRKELMLVLLRITRVTGIRYLSSAQVFCNKYTDSNLEACFRGAVMRIIQENHEITLFRVVWYVNYSITVLQFGKKKYLAQISSPLIKIAAYSPESHMGSCLVL